MTQKEKHLQALDHFIDIVKGDPNIIALFLNGSLAYGTVWEKSDIDLEVIIRDGSSPSSNTYVVFEDDIEINLFFTEASKLKKYLHEAKGGNVWLSMYALGTLVFTKDESIRTYMDDLEPVPYLLFNDFFANFLFLCVSVS